MRALLGLLDGVGCLCASRHRCALASVEMVLMFAVIAFYAIVLTGTGEDVKQAQRIYALRRHKKVRRRQRDTMPVRRAARGPAAPVIPHVVTGVVVYK